MTQIFVGNLAFNAIEADIRRAFEVFGRVTSVRMISDHITNQSRGFAFVTMPSLDDADEAIMHMSGSSLNGRQIKVNEAASRDRSSGETSRARDTAMAVFAALQNE